MLTIDADPVRKVSIIPRGLALGVTFSAPDADRYNYERIELMARIKVALGGRVAEELVLGEPTTGAESDIVQLTEIGRQMVGRWGMSDVIGPIAVVQTDGRGPWSLTAGETSPRTQELVDEEVRRIVEEAHEEVTTLLIEHPNRTGQQFKLVGTEKPVEDTPEVYRFQTPVKAGETKSFTMKEERDVTQSPRTCPPRRRPRSADPRFRAHAVRARREVVCMEQTSHT